ncbi:MAG: hypothetical protein OXC44_07810 [Proteobacteria bacterium]|nr:hypothetical protein [Pseudomonadota bacterium]
MMFHGCAEEEAATSKLKPAVDHDLDATSVVDPEKEGPKAPTSAKKQLPNPKTEVINTYSTKLNAFRDKMAQDHCISGQTAQSKKRSQEISTVLAALSCRVTEQKAWLADELIYASSAASESCQTQADEVDEDIMSFSDAKVVARGVDGWLEYQCKKAVDHILDEKFTSAQKKKLVDGHAVLEAKVTKELDKILNKKVPYKSQTKGFGILASLKNTIYQINNNCAAVALTSDFADTVLSSSANERVKLKYIYRETFSAESGEHIDKLIRASWEDIQKSSYKIKAFSDFSGADAATASTVDTIESLQTFLDYSPAHATKSFYAQRELKVTCEQDIAYTKMNKIISTNPARTRYEPTGTFFSHGDFHVPLNKTGLACGANDHAGKAVFKRVIKKQSPSSSVVSDSEGGLSVECRIAKGYAPKTDFATFIGTPEDSRLIINLTPDTRARGGEDGESPPARGDYLSRLKAHDAIVCHKRVLANDVPAGETPQPVTDCDDTFTDMLYDADDVEASLSSLHIVTKHDDEGSGHPFNDGHEAERILNEIMTLKLEDGRHGDETLLREVAHVKSPLSAFLKNKGGRFSKVGQLLLAFDADTSDTVSDQWQNSVTDETGDGQPVSNFGGWDFPDASRVAGPLCLYYIHINANNAARRLENRRALEKLFGLKTIEDETQCLAGLNHMDRDVCSVSDSVTSSWSQEEKARFETFCDSGG